MPRYRITLSDGRIVTVEADAPPSEADVLGAMGGDSSSPPPVEPPVEPEGKSLGGFLGNVMSSGGKFVGDTVAGFPGMLKTAGTAMSALSGNQQAVQEMQGMVPGVVEGVKAIPGMVAERYGSVDKALNTAYEDPVGVAADVSTVLGMGGATAPGRTGRFLTRASDATNPMRAATAPARAAGRGLQSAGVSAYERMLKPNKATLEGMPAFGDDLQARSRNVAEALIRDQRGQISKRGAQRYADVTSGLQSKVDEIVDANPEARGSTGHLVTSLQGSRGRFQNQWAPKADLSAYDAVADEVLNNPRIQKTQRGVVTRTTQDDLGHFGEETGVESVGRSRIPRVRAQTARRLTQGTYRNLGDKAYGELQGAAKEAQKAAARGGRAVLNEALPQVEPINNAISKRIDLGQVLDEAVFRSGKHDPIGLGQQVVLSGSNPGFLLASLLNRPGLGSPVARGVYRAGGALTNVGGEALIRAALLARLNEQEQP